MSRVTRMFDNDSDEEKNPDLSWFDQTKSKMKVSSKQVKD